MNKVITITLPSFLRRVLKAYLLKSHIRSLGGELQRIGRSRNWLLKAHSNQLLEITSMIEEADEASWLWVAKLLCQHHSHLESNELLFIAARLPDITVASLINKTNCTLAQARKTLDELERFDE